jgi:hypothetical protein
MEANRFQSAMERRRARLLFAVPKLKRVGERHITEHFVRAIVRHKDRGAGLKIRSDVPYNSDG